MYFYKTLAIGLCPVEPTKRETDLVRLCPTESIRQHFTPSVNTSVYFTKSLAIGLCPVEPTQRQTDRVRPCPTESICQHFTPSVNTSMYFSKSLAIGLPVSRTVAYPRRSDSVRVYWTCMKQNHIIRVLFFATLNGKCTESALPLMNLLDILPVENIFRLQLLKFSHQWHKKQLPSIFDEFFSLCQ